MKKRYLRDIEVSEIGMGCMAFSHGYGQIPDEEYAISCIRAAYDHGYTFFDTAVIYGPNLQQNGHNELIVGKALKDLAGQVVIATKLHLNAREVEEKGSVYKAIESHLDESEKRLQMPVDLYYLHRYPGDVQVEEITKAMGWLIEEGRIKGWGLSAVDVDIIDRAQRVTPLSAVQNIYSMMERDVQKTVIPYCEEHRIGLVAFSPIASGLLSGKITPKTQYVKFDDVRNWVPQASEENRLGNQPIVDLITDFARKKNCTNAQIALAWMLKTTDCVVPIPGSKNRNRIIENLDAANVDLSEQEFEELNQPLSKLKVYGHRGYTESGRRHH